MQEKRATKATTKEDQGQDILNENKKIKRLNAENVTLKQKLLTLEAVLQTVLQEAQQKLMNENTRLTNITSELTTTKRDLKAAKQMEYNAHRVQ
jgi:hypothetical protein